MFTKNLVLIILTTIISAAFLGCHNYTAEDRANYIVSHMKSDLDLNDSQLAKLEVVKHEWLENEAAQKPQREKEGDQVIAMIRADKLDVPALKAIIKDHEEKFNMFSPKLLDSLADFHASLTAKQREKLADKLQELRKKYSHN